MRRKKHTYLYKLALIIILILFVPITVFFNVFWKKAFEEMEKSNQAYYEKIVESFTDSFEVKIMELKEYAATIVAKSKDTKSALWRGSEGYNENSYWYYEAREELVDEFNDHGVSMCGIYYYDIAYIVSSRGTQTLDSFIYSKLQVEDEETEQKLRDYFAAENWNGNKLVFCSGNSQQEQDEEMLMGYCTNMGKNQERVMIFFLIAPNDFQDSLSIVYGSKGINFYITDSDNEEVYLALGDAANDYVNLPEVDWKRNIGGSEQHVIYQRNIGRRDCAGLIYITEDSQLGDIVGFYNNMRIVLWITTLILLVVCLAALYVAYRPMYQLTSELDDYDGDEFQTIRNALDDHNARIQEQEMLIMDLLVKHLIHGVPISAKRIKRLGIDTTIQHYCVFVLEGQTLLTAEIERITEEIEKRFSARLFVTDWQGENRNVLILFMKNAEVEPVESWLSGWFEEYLVDEYAFYSGNVVDKLDDIRSSLLSCLERKKVSQADGKAIDKQAIKDEVKTLNVKEEQQRKLKEEILAYLEAHFRDEDLCQTQVADAFRISNYSLSRMFKNQIGVGFIEYVNAKRMEYAKELLLTTSYSVRDISVMVGFASDNYFSRIFKATVGVSPTAFREQ